MSLEYEKTRAELLTVEQAAWVCVLIQIRREESQTVSQTSRSLFECCQLFDVKEDG